MHKAVGYIRVSTTEQAQEGISLAAQQAKIKAYCDLNDFELVEIISDAGKTGKNLNREGIQHAMHLVESQQVDALVVYKLDRLSRKTRDTLDLIERIESAGGAFHSITEKVDTKSAIGKFFLTITAAFAQMERDTISERTREALQHKQNEGQYLGAVPFGFKLDENELRRAESEAAIVEMIKRLYNEGLTQKQIAEHLNSKEIKSKRGGHWYQSSVRNVLKRAKVS